MALTVWLEGTLYSSTLVVLDLVLLTGYSALDASAGGTLGKRILRIHVLGVDGQPASAGKRLLRAVLKNGPIVASLVLGMVLLLSTAESPAPGELPIVLLASSTASGMFLFVALGDALCMLGEQRQALHDILSGTSVFEKPRAQDAAATLQRRRAVGT